MTPDERTEALAKVLHDWVGGCCVNRFDDCVFGGSGVREEAARLLKYPALRDLLASERAKALREAADDIVAQMVCCDVYERLKSKPSGYWTADDRAEYRRHGICYWGMASSDLVSARADREVQP